MAENAAENPEVSGRERGPKATPPPTRTPLPTRDPPPTRTPRRLHRRAAPGAKLCRLHPACSCRPIVYVCVCVCLCVLGVGDSSAWLRSPPS